MENNENEIKTEKPLAETPAGVNEKKELILEPPAAQVSVPATTPVKATGAETQNREFTQKRKWKQRIDKEKYFSDRQQDINASEQNSSGSSREALREGVVPERPQPPKRNERYNNKNKFVPRPRVVENKKETPQTYRRYGEIRTPDNSRPVTRYASQGQTPDKSFSDKQKDLYDGRDAEYRPIYQDEHFFKEYMDSHIKDTKGKGIFGYSLKAIKNAEELKKLKLKNFESLLDAGCGPGILLNQLKAKYGIKGYGVDISSMALSRAKEAGNNKMDFRQGKLEQIPFPNRYFDVVVSFDVLEHVEDKNKSLKEIYRVLKPRGRALLYAISKRDLFTWHWFLRVISFGKIGVDAKGGHIRENFVEPFELSATLEKLGAKKIKKIYFHSFWTLAVDEILFKLANSGKVGKPVYISGVQTAQNGAGKNLFVKRVLYAVLSVLFPLLEVLDLPWKLAGLSNGFFIYFEKGDRDV